MVPQPANPNVCWSKGLMVQVPNVLGSNGAMVLEINDVELQRSDNQQSEGAVVIESQARARRACCQLCKKPLHLERPP